MAFGNHTDALEMRALDILVHQHERIGDPVLVEALGDFGEAEQPVGRGGEIEIVVAAMIIQRHAAIGRLRRIEPAVFEIARDQAIGPVEPVETGLTPF